jgi:cell wall-associated NlpC family hydrolase
MSEQLFDVVFFGILQNGKDKATVVRNMATLFKTEASKVAPFFAGGRKVIKGKINASAAEKYRNALENVGLVIKIEPCEITQDKKETSSAAQVDISGLSLAPVGSDVIENPTEVPAQEIADVSSITMAEAGTDVIENPVAVPPQKIDDISNITMAEAGVNVLEHPKEVIPQEIGDISDITLAEPGADVIANPRPKEKAAIPDTSELTLSDEKN